MAPIGGEILVLLLLAAAHCFAQEILRPPENTTVFLNQSAVFTCETRDGLTSWRFNGTQRELLLPEIRSDLITSVITTPEGSSVQNLTIPARAQYNGTIVQCLSVEVGVSFVESYNATLTIQGTLSAVGDLRASSNASSVTISWSAPFSLDVTGVDPDIWYSVLIYNENNPTAISSVNVTNTSYTFTPDSATTCQKFLFSVIPLNGAGQGESSPNITGYVINSSALIMTHIRAISREKTNVTFITRGNPTSKFCSSWRVTPDVVDDLVIEEPPSPEGPDVTYQLRADNRYSFLVSLPNTTSGVAHPPINFTTYDVQSAAANTTKGTNNKINLTAEFIESTTAQGCFVVLECEYGNPDVLRAILLPNDSSTSVESTIDNILSSTYHVLVYDLEEDGRPNSHPAVEQNTIVTVTGNGPFTDAESHFMNNGSLYWNGTAVNVRCEFKEGIEGASCVLVYREYGNKTLVVEEYPQNTVFPVTLTVGADLEKYTFALFGKNGSSFDERPIIAGKINVTETTTPVSTSSDGSTPSMDIGVSTVSFLIVIIAIAQLMSNGGGTQQQIDVYAEGPPTQYVSTPPQMSKQKGIYTDVEPSTSAVQPPIPEEYQEIDFSTRRLTSELLDIGTTHKMAPSQYADLGPLPAGRPKPLEMDTRTQCPYVTVLPHATTPVNDNGPPTVESVMSLLWGVAGRWKEIAEGLEFDGDQIDEIDTNNDMNEGCLQVFVEIWVTRLQPSWEKLSSVLRDLGEVELARQALNKEPQEQWQVPSRQTSDTSSSGIVASYQSTDFSGEVVPGVEETVAPDDGNNEDGCRGGKKTMPNDCSSGEQDARSVFFAYPALHEGGPTVSESCDEDEETKCDVGTEATVQSEEREKVTIVSGTYLFDFPYKPSFEECQMFSPLEGNDDPDFAQDSVSTQGSDDDYHSGSFSFIVRQKSAATFHTAKVVGRDVITGGVVVVPQQSTGFSDITGPEETDTTRSPFRQPAKEVVNDSLSMCVNESQQSAGRFGLNKAVYLSFSFPVGQGMLVIGGPYTRRDIFKKVPLEPPPDPEENQPQPSPEETDSSQPLPPEPTPPQSQLPEVSPLQLQENYPPTPPPDTVKEWQGLNPPGKIMKWLEAGVSRGLRGRMNSLKGAPHSVELPSSAAISK